MIGQCVIVCLSVCPILCLHSFRSLNQNRISTIQLAAFMGLHNFTYLHLANNSLKNLKEGAIIDVPNLKTV
jgi:hypothetical protein